MKSPCGLTREDTLEVLLSFNDNFIDCFYETFL